MSRERVPFSLIEEFTHISDRPCKPMNMHCEMRFTATIDENRLRSAVGVAVASHPMARARMVTARRRLCPPLWEIGEPDLNGVVHSIRCESETDLNAARADFINRPIDIRTAPAVRLLLVRHPVGESLLVSTNHTISDGIGVMRLIHSISRAYSSRPDPPPNVDSLVARSFQGLGRVRPPGRPPTRANGQLSVITPDGETGEPGYGFVTRIVPAERRRCLDPRRFGPSSTINDLLLAALHLAIEEWNTGHGRASDRIAVFIPSSLRPMEWYNEVVGNLTLGGKVTSNADERSDPKSLMVAVMEQTAWIKGGGGIAGLFGQPRWVRSLLPVVLPRLTVLMPDRGRNSAVLTYFGQIDRELPDFGPGAGELVEFFGSPPVGMPMGLAVGANLFRGRLHFAFRYRLALFGTEAAERFADLFLEILTRLGEIPGEGEGPEPVRATPVQTSPQSIGS